MGYASNPFRALFFGTIPTEITKSRGPVSQRSIAFAGRIVVVVFFTFSCSFWKSTLGLLVKGLEYSDSSI